MEPWAEVWVVLRRVVRRVRNCGGLVGCGGTRERGGHYFFVREVFVCHACDVEREIGLKGEILYGS